MHYKAPDNSIHYLDDDSFWYLLPAGSVQITDEEAAQILGQSVFVPKSVTMRQARLALLQAGLLDGVDDAIASIQNVGQRRAAQIEWEYSNEVHRNKAWLQNLSIAMGLTDQQVDDLFIAAAQL